MSNKGAMFMTGTWGVIFDWDGVLVDSSDLHRRSWDRLGEALGLPVPEGSFERGFGMKNEVIIPEILGWAKDPGEVASLADRKERLYRELAAAEGLSFLPGAKVFLDRLRDAEARCVIGSSTERANIMAILDANGGRSRFHAIVSAEDVSHGKPHPEVFEKAHAALGTDRAVVIEDALPGVEAARRAGLPVIAVTTTRSRDELCDADRIVDDLAELEVDELAAWLGT